ncbi:MAG: hypothetical protein M5U16_16260 [Hyphomicrobium sp.]|nr:hypothetical protein [Hyphomicrobium sp.]
MDGFIKLNKVITSQISKPIDVEVSQISRVEEYRGRARIWFGPDDDIRVCETPDEVRRLIAAARG